MTLNKKQKQAQAAIQRLRDKRFKYCDIAMATGVSVGYLSGIAGGYRNFSDEVADKIIAGCKGVKP